MSSDDFDKEAEREKLREKYEQEQQDRAQTQRMSELLLQGATMTNRHCDTCGDPVFRYEGQEFCATCRAEADDTGQQTAAQSDQQAAADRPESQSADADQPAELGVEPTATEAEAGAASGSEAESTPAQDPSQPAEVREPTSEPAAQSAPASGDAGLGEARDALAGTITQLSRRAGTADDPRRAREFLEAAHEAADTIDALPER